MLKLSLLLVVLMLGSLSSYSQVDKTEAIIVFQNSDTVYAEIKDEQLHLIQARIYYRQPGANNFSIGLPNQIKSVKFADGRLFETVKTDSASFLLLCLIEGYFDLYTKAETKGLNNYYLRHAQDQPIHLFETFQDQYEETEGEVRRKSNFEYAHQLTNAMADNAKITMKISEMKFKEDNLVALVKEYNEFKGTLYPAFSGKKQKSTKISTGILISGYPLLTDFHAPGLGMCFDLYRNRPYEKFGLKTRVSFNILDYKKDDSYTFIIEIPIGVSYKYFERSRVKLDVFGGISSFLIIDSDISYGVRDTDSTFAGSLYLGTGVDYKIRKSAFRFEFSLIPMTLIFAYIF
jgi:hypothetical protein